VHEFDLPAAESSDRHPDPPPVSNAAAQKAATPPQQREGLPSHYRMRAERHYVDQLLSPSTAAPVRMIRVSEFADTEHIGSGQADILTKSIRMHGVIQPLLVRKMGTGYQIIAGKKRLAAAIVAGLEQVPCIVHDVDDDGAARLRTAEGVRGEAPPDLRAIVAAKLAGGISETVAELSRLQGALALLQEPSSPLQKHVAIDLVAAQAWRTLWSAKLAAVLAAGPAPDVRRRPLAAVVDDVIRRFEPECRLSRLRLSARYHGGASAEVDDALIGFALTGAIIMTISLLDKGVDPALEVHCHRLGDAGISLEVVQHHSMVSRETVMQFSNQAFSAPAAPGSIALGAIALAHATATYGGAAQLVVTSDPGSSLHLTFPQL
jgi:hypothetical protein